LNEVATVTATFSVIKDIRDHEPTDMALLVLPSGLQFVKGDSVWVGKLEKGLTVTLQAQIKAVRPGQYCFVGGEMWCYEVPFDRLSERAKRLRSKGIEAKSFYCGDYGRTDRFAVEGPAEQPEVKESQKTTEGGGVSQELVPVTMPVEEGRPHFGFALKPKEGQEGTRPYGPVQLKRNEGAIFYFYKEDLMGTVNAIWSVVPSSMGTIIRLQGKKVLFTAGERPGDCQIVARVKGVEHVIRVRISDKGLRR
jgi:hypothetical protein